VAPKVKEKKRRRSAGRRCAIRGFILADHDQIARALTSQILRFRNLFAIHSGADVSGCGYGGPRRECKRTGLVRTPIFLNRLTAAGRFSASRAGHLTSRERSCLRITLKPGPSSRVALRFHLYCVPFRGFIYDGSTVFQGAGSRGVRRWQPGVAWPDFRLRVIPSFDPFSRPGASSPGYKGPFALAGNHVICPAAVWNLKRVRPAMRFKISLFSAEKEIVKQTFRIQAALASTILFAVWLSGCGKESTARSHRRRQRCPGQ
jgi:hypothetical protein